VPTKAIHITVAACVVSTLLHPRGDKRADDVDLGAPTLVLNSAARSQLSPLLLLSRITHHTDHITASDHITNYCQAVAVMADGSSPTRLVPATSDQFYSAGKELRTKKLRTRFEEALNSDSKSPGFVPIEIPEDQHDLARAMTLFEHEVGVFGVVFDVDHAAQSSF
jgi:hypothetical protein